MTFKELVASKGFTPTTLSRESSVEIRTVTRYISGVGGGIQNAHSYNRRMIAQALGITEKDMMEVLK